MSMRYVIDQRLKDILDSIRAAEDAKSSEPPRTPAWVSWNQVVNSGAAVFNIALGLANYTFLRSLSSAAGKK